MTRRLTAIILALLLAVPCALAQYDKDVFYYRGRQALSDGRYSQAIENFNILARLDTTDYWTFFFRGIAKYNLGDLRGAQQDFDTSVRLDPVFTNGYHYRAITLSRFGRYEEALADFDKAMELRPGYNGLYFSRGVTYFLARRFEEAVSDFDRYLRKEPKDPAAYLNRGASYLYMGDTLKAERDYNKAIKLDRFDPEGYIRRGSLHASRGRYEEAIADLNKAISLDSTSTLAHYNRALMYFETKDYNSAMADFNKVLQEEPGNALTLYNRSIISARVGNYEDALADMDRVININPGNVLAYYNRASFFLEMGRLRSALEDYDKAIELYPDFAKAYMSRSYVKNLMGMRQSSKEDYDTARRKVSEYKARSAEDASMFADTTRNYTSLIALDADFAKKNFDNELLQNRDIDIRLRPLYKFRLTGGDAPEKMALRYRYENALLERFEAECPVNVAVSNNDSLPPLSLSGVSLANLLAGDSASGAGRAELTEAQKYFLRGLFDLQNRQFSTALSNFDAAVEAAPDELSRSRYADFYKAFYLMNRGVLRAEMIDFIASIQNNVQTLTMDDQGSIRARVGSEVTRTYDYSEAIDDLRRAIELVPELAYLHFDLGNLYCLSSQMLSSMESYDRAISLYPYFGDAYFNRGLVLIYLKDREKGCIDLSRAGELGVADAYGVIAKYCEEKQR